MRAHFVFFLVGLTLLFGGCTASEPTLPITATSLTLQPGDVTVAPGETIDLEAVIEPSGGTWGLLWNSSGGALSASGTKATFVAPTAIGEYTITVALPGEALDDSLVVSVVSHEVASQSVKLTSVTGELRIATGTTLALAATVTGSETTELVWHVDGGQISATGYGAVYTAPPEAGDYVVTATLPDNDDIVGSLTVAVPGAILEPFTIAVIPDTQTLVRYSASRSLVKGIGQWLVDNVDEHNISFVSHLGDVVWHATTATAPSAVLQWTAALAGLDLLDGVVPYSVSLGDHEYEIEEDKTSSTAAYFEHFGPSRYVDYDWYGGSHEVGLSHYQVFEAGGREFLHLNLEWEPLGPADDETTPLGWARKVLEEHPQLPTFISTHAYLWDMPGEEGHFPDAAKEGFLAKKGDIAPDTASGVEIFETLVEPFPQVLMVFNGHYHKAPSASGSRGEYRQTSLNDAGLEVYEMLSNYQWMDHGDDPDWIRLIEFHPGAAGEQDRIEVSTFSPSRGTYSSGAASSFGYDLDLAERFALH